jgi:hypothetical protein
LAKQKTYYKEGKKHGEGTYSWNDGSKYIHSWLDGRQREKSFTLGRMVWEHSYDKKYGFGYTFRLMGEDDIFLQKLLLLSFIFCFLLISLIFLNFFSYFSYFFLFFS